VGGSAGGVGTDLHQLLLMVSFTPLLLLLLLLLQEKGFQITV
jgi:hypothetical protein